MVKSPTSSSGLNGGLCGYRHAMSSRIVWTLTRDASPVTLKTARLCGYRDMQR